LIFSKNYFRRIYFILLIFLLSTFSQSKSNQSYSSDVSGFNDLILGPQINKRTNWIGNKVVNPSLEILILAGHADSQGILNGSGTSGEAVALKGELSLDKNISDELFWNIKVRDAIVKLGKRRGLNIRSYEPGIRKIIDPNDERTNWSVGAKNVKKGGYSLEIHFDSYGKYGNGSGLIPPLSSKLNNIDESLARSFGRYPLFFRGGLGAPRRGIRILEIGKLEGSLERNLRDLQSREKMIKLIANKVVDAILKGIYKVDLFNPKLDEGNIFLPSSYP
tara:strand:+ start:65 stop:895 length:831 start_codon:yes stop_codon:yes gene_type:complete